MISVLINADLADDQCPKSASGISVKYVGGSAYRSADGMTDASLFRAFVRAARGGPRAITIFRFLRIPTMSNIIPI